MCQQQPRRPQSRERDRLAPAPVTARRMRENREYVRALLARKQPEFARALAVAEQEIAGMLGYSHAAKHAPPGT